MLKHFFEKAPELDNFKVRGGHQPLHHWTHGVLTLAFILLLSSYMRSFQHAGQVLHFAKGLPPLLLSMYIFYRIWREQNIILLRYNLQDDKAYVLMFASLLVTVLFIFPLKYLFSWLAGHFYFLLWRVPAGKVFFLHAYDRPEVIPEPILAWLLAFFALGGVVMGLCFYLLYEYSLKAPVNPGLTEVEEALTAYAATRWLTLVWVASLSALLAFASLISGNAIPLFLAGTVYPVIWLIAPLQMRRAQRRLQALKEEL